jgi:hypothetical protein
LNHYNLSFKRRNPDYQCLKITSCRWRPPPRMHSFTATRHFKSSRSFVSPCVCCMLCRMRLKHWYFGLLSLKRQVVMVQFLSINFFSWISSIFVGFFKSSLFFWCHTVHVLEEYLNWRNRTNQYTCMKHKTLHIISYQMFRSLLWSSSSG